MWPIFKLACTYIYVRVPFVYFKNEMKGYVIYVAKYQTSMHRAILKCLIFVYILEGLWKIGRGGGRDPFSVSADWLQHTHIYTWFFSSRKRRGTVKKKVSGRAKNLREVGNQQQKKGGKYYSERRNLWNEGWKISNQVHMNHMFNFLCFMGFFAMYLSEVNNLII